MANVILLIAILLAGASYTSFTARNAAVSDGPNWATNICSSAHQFCQYPYQMAYAAAGLTAFWLLLKFVSAIRD
jgi:hypothetical protein